MPKFHARRRSCSYTTNCQYPKPGSNLQQPTIRLEGDMLYLPKIPKGIKLHVHRRLPEGAVIGHVTVSFENGNWYFSIEYRYEVEMNFDFRNAAINNDISFVDTLTFLGLDYSNPSLYVDSEGRTANYPHFYRQAEAHLAVLQKKLSAMTKGSNNYKRQLDKIAKLSAKIARQRADFLHKLSYHLVKDYDVICVEDINLRNMAQMLSLGKNLYDNGFGMFRNMLAYKLNNKGSVLIRVDKPFASTKTCHHCGNKNPDVKLGMSEWTCPVCGAVLCRDHNAAINIQNEGKRIFIEYMNEYINTEAKAKTRAAALSSARKASKKKP
jgi:putative transposase